MSNKNVEEKMLTLSEAAKKLKGLSAASLRRLAAENKIPGAVKISAPGNDYWMIPESSLDKIRRQPAGRPVKNKKPE